MSAQTLLRTDTTLSLVAFCTRHLPTAEQLASLGNPQAVTVPQRPRPHTARLAWIAMAAACPRLPDAVVYMGRYPTWYPFARSCRDYRIVLLKAATNRDDTWQGFWWQAVWHGERLGWQAWQGVAHGES